MTTERLAAYSRQISDLLREARELAEVPAVERDTDDYRARLAAYNALKVQLLAGPTEAERDR
jgi:hypothetical protein